MESMILEAARNMPVWADVDICVLGGSCTGLFAAVRASRMGMRVALVEAQNRLGGTATCGLVNVWHSLLDDTYSVPVIGGLTAEVERRMERAGRIRYVEHSPDIGAQLDTSYLTYLLDCLAQEAGIILYLHTTYTGLITEGDTIVAATLHNKDGNGAVRSRFFIDCTGDGDLCRDLGMPAYRFENIQPPSACFYMTGETDGIELAELILKHGREFGLDDDWGWSGPIPGLKDMYFRADNHVFGVDCSRADDLTKAEIEGRRRAYALEALLTRYGKREHRIAALCTRIGIRDTAHYSTQHQVTRMELLMGKEFEDTVLRGTYRVDVHHQEDNGITFQYLNGELRTYYGKTGKADTGNWREELGMTGEPAHYYNMPFQALVQEKVDNFIAAGRMLHADDGAFGALRVMVNTNQMGEAAGVAAALCLQKNLPVHRLNGMDVRKALRDGGSLV